MTCVQFIDGKLIVYACQYQGEDADIEIQLPDEGALAPRHILKIVEAESLVKLVRQAIAQAREMKRSLPVDQSRR